MFWEMRSDDNFYIWVLDNNKVFYICSHDITAEIQTLISAL